MILLPFSKGAFLNADFTPLSLALFSNPVNLIIPSARDMIYLHPLQNGSPNQVQLIALKKQMIRCFLLPA